MRWNVRRHGSGDPRAMQRLYWLEDPWGLDNAEEHFRFRETARIIRERIAPRFGSILEVGCGEGLQTSYLAPLADQITGIDPSEDAVRRARRRGIANAHFQTVDFANYCPPEHLFNLVTACEVLYYFADIGEVVRRMSSMARFCVVTYYEGEAQSLDQFFRNGVEMVTIREPEVQWRLVWWRNAN